MTPSLSSPGYDPPAWRRKWRRVDPERRRIAAAALADVFERRRARVSAVLAWALVVSVILHAASAPLLLSSQLDARGTIAAGEASYLQKVLQKERAKVESRKAKQRLTMPPAPLDPEAVVKDTLSEGLTSDVQKVVGDLLEAHVTEDLSDYVKANLEGELAAAAKDIADGNLSEDQIKQLQETMKRKAHDLAVTALRRHRIKTQVKRTQISVTKWYENDVSRTMMKNIYYEMFLRPHKGGVWARCYAGMYFGQRGKHYNWSQAKALEYLRKKRGAVRRLIAGLPIRGYHPEPLATWPKPSGELAEAMRSQLRSAHTYDPSWRALVHGGADKHKRGTGFVYQHRTDGLLKEFYPHREAEMRKVADEVSARWDTALAAADAYVQAGDAGESAVGLKKAHDALVAALKELDAQLPRLARVDDRAYRAVNSIVRSRVLRGPERERVYKRFVDKMVAGLGPLIQDFAIGQFEDGIIKWDKTAKEAMAEFPRIILPLLRRDVMRLVPKKKFNHLAFHGDYADRSYLSRITGTRRNWPTPKDIANDEAEFKRLAGGSAALRAYAEKRSAILTRHFERAIDHVAAEMLSRVLSQGLLFRDLAAFVEGVDFADKVQEKLDARKRAMDGRGQDLAKLTKDGVPDTSAAQFALVWGGSKRHSANLVPTETTMQPAFFGRFWPDHAVRGSKPRLPPLADKWGFERQVEVREVRPKFDPPSPRFEAIPFLPKFPRLDGSVGDLAKLRPLVLRPRSGGKPVFVYAAWNYQGFFFCYHVAQPAERFYWPVPTQASFSSHGSTVQHRKAKGVGWAYTGDSCRLLFDTLDARNQNRGEPHTQEFVVFPRGTDSNPYAPGIERVVASQRDAITKEYRGVKSSCRMFPSQPMPEQGPDGTGPYRITDFGKDGYTVEVFLYRKLFKLPVFAPGWYVGFDCAVATGAQRNRRFRGCTWAAGNADRPRDWGDLLLLGTDPQIFVQKAEPDYPLAGSVSPGRSYLLTIKDPDRNVYLSRVDRVLVSAEVRGGRNDVEVFVLKETGENTGVFRGFINTQPGRGREVRGFLEVMPGNEVRFGYVDTANSTGRRNAMYEVTLPVLSPVSHRGEE